jgi:hypothetical protein
MRLREIFTKLRTDLSTLNPNELVLVYYDELKHELSFRQLNVVILTPYISPYFLPKKKFKLGVLTQLGLNKLMYNLEQLLSSTLIDEGLYIPNLQTLSTGWYRFFKSVTIPGPQKTLELNYCNVTNRFVVRWLCNHYNNNSKVIYKSIMRSINMSKKSNNNHNGVD